MDAAVVGPALLWLGVATMILSMNHWFRLALIWGIAWTVAMILCLALRAPGYVIAGIGFGGGAYPLIWLGAGIVFGRANRSR